MNRRNQRRLAVLCFAVATWSLESGAGDRQYHWENKQGEAVYSDRPPPAGVEYELTDTHPGLSYVEPDKPALENSGTDTSGNSAIGAGGNPESGDSQKDPALCEKARMNLIVLEKRSGLTVRNEEGQPRELTPEDVEFAKENARRQIELYCD